MNAKLKNRIFTVSTVNHILLITICIFENKSKCFI